MTNVAVIMTIHQPSALVFELLDDLLLLENGQTVYAGSIHDADGYFTSIGLPNMEKINPADFYLDLAQKIPPGYTTDTPIKYRDLFAKSTHHEKFEKHMNMILNDKVTKPVALQPSSLSRFQNLFLYFMKYFIIEKGFYIYRLVSLITLALFIGSLYFDLQPLTTNITKYVGALFFAAICLMLTAVSCTAIFAKDRYEAVDRVSNGIYTPGIFVLAQSLACAIYDIFVSFVFVCIFHWMTNLNPNIESFIYDWLINWANMMLMESALLLFVEVLKNDFLSTTSAMIFIGTNMSFNGFFRPINDMPNWISWMAYIIPLKVIFISNT